MIEDLAICFHLRFSRAQEFVELTELSVFDTGDRVRIATELLCRVKDITLALNVCGKMCKVRDLSVAVLTVDL
jgi:hypothetical protein